MLYPFSISIDATVLTGNNTLNKAHFAGLVEANNKDEALGKATRIMRDVKLIGVLADCSATRDVVVGESIVLDPNTNVITLG